MPRSAISLQTKSSSARAIPCPRRSGSTYTAHMLGVRSGRVWKSLSMTPAPATILPSSSATYHCGAAPPSPAAQHASMLVRYSSAATSHFEANHADACSMMPGCSRTGTISKPLARAASSRNGLFWARDRSASCACMGPPVDERGKRSGECTTRSICLQNSLGTCISPDHAPCKDLLTLRAALFSWGVGRF